MGPARDRPAPRPHRRRDEPPPGGAGLGPSGTDRCRPQWRALYGVNPVREALAAGRKIEKASILSGPRGSELERLHRDLEAAGVPVTEGDRDRLAHLADTLKHQGIVARVEALVNGSLKGYVEDHPGTPLTVLVTDHIQDPQNLGAIYRAADAFGVGLVFLPAQEACSHQLGSVAKASAGAVEHVRSVVVSQLARAVGELKGHGFTVVGLASDGTSELSASVRADRLALVVGGEGEGLSSAMRDLCDHTVHIPSAGKVSSLNASMACGIALYERFRKVGATGGQGKVGDVRPPEKPVEECREVVVPADGTLGDGR